MTAFAMHVFAAAAFWALMGVLILIIRWRREEKRRKRTPMVWGR